MPPDFGEAFRSRLVWFSSYIEKNWPEIKSAVGPAHMPGARRGKPHELGCGAYGCVYKTRTPGEVLKATFDVLEGAFVREAIALGEFPPGIVRYYTLLEHPHLDLGEDLDINQDYEDATLFLLWREEAFVDGGKSPLPPEDRLELAERKHLERTHHLFGDLAEALNLVLRYSLGSRLAERRRALRDVPYLRSEMERSVFIASQEQALERAAYLFAGAEDLLVQTKLPRLIPAYQAIAFYMARGFLLPDTHAANLAAVHREGQSVFVIIDPSRAIDFRSAL